MQTQVTKLRRTLSLLQPAVPKRPTLDALRYVRLGEGKAVATDLDVTIIVDLPEAQDGVCLLPFTTVENFLRFTPGSLPLGIVPRDGRVHLLAQSSVDIARALSGKGTLSDSNRCRQCGEPVSEGSALCARCEGSSTLGTR